MKNETNWREASQKAHDASGITQPAAYMWREINGVQYPCRLTQYAIYKRLIAVFKRAFPDQKLDKQVIIRWSNDVDMLTIYCKY